MSVKVMKFDVEKMQVALATDVGSTTTKARLFKKVDGVWRFICAGEAPTTVEKPFEDVTMGLRNAITEVEELTGHKLLKPDGSGLIIPYQGNNVGVDLYVSTSSAGGGLQMMVAGVVKTMTAESAERAALGAGAIVMDVMAIDDGRPPHKKIERMRFLRPDMILLAGGTDGGTIKHVVEMAELIKAAEPKPRFGLGYKLPIVYAGNKDAREHIKKTLGETFDLTIVDNLRPVLEVEVVEPARDAIHRLFMEHVMAHAPGYHKLTEWVMVPVMPTPAGEGMMFRTIAKMWNINVLGVGLGGATTNVYSVYEGKFVRTVSANLGMSYSITNVLKEAGVTNIMRWLPFEMDEREVRNRLANKMIRPTTLPQTLDDLLVEHAVAREAIRLGFEHHKLLARGLRGVQRRRTIADIFEQSMETETYINMMNIQLIGGTGGLLSHTPRRQQAALILIDAFQPKGVTRLMCDSIFMMPHLGVLSTVHPKAAMEIFERDCIVKLGTVIALDGHAKSPGPAVKVTAHMPDGRTVEKVVNYGDIDRIPLRDDETATVIIEPTGDFDVGMGPGKRREATVWGGAAGIVIDARGRPLKLPEDFRQRREALLRWFKALNAYPETIMSKEKI
ncbi:MAG: glutamate mutase L [Candidatus Verstraetearchaeota archaeon]|nr:glutamate mutase L [Candidatus Verstraetearchaeota archaeon]